MPATDERYSHAQLVERLARLETKVHLKFAELDKALILAATNVEKEKNLMREETSAHFMNVNNFQQRMDKLIDTFASREWVVDKIDPLRKLVYVGVGFAIALELVLRYVFKA